MPGRPHEDEGLGVFINKALAPRAARGRGGRQFPSWNLDWARRCNFIQKRDLQTGARKWQLWVKDMALIIALF